MMSMSGMSMSTSMSDMPTSTMSGMSMASSTSMDMSSSSSMMGMDTMAMTFFTSTTTPLFSMSWTPNTVGQYAGTCIFLIAFAAIFRALLAMRCNFSHILAGPRHRNGEGPIHSFDEEKKLHVRPWRARESVIVASLDVVLSGIGYLLMIAVMTMNVGYFLSILAGIFLGSLVFSRYMTDSAAH